MTLSSEKYTVSFEYAKDNANERADNIIDEEFQKNNNKLCLFYSDTIDLAEFIIWTMGQLRFDWEEMVVEQTDIWRKMSEAKKKIKCPLCESTEATTEYYDKDIMENLIECKSCGHTSMSK